MRPSRTFLACAAGLMAGALIAAGSQAPSPSRFSKHGVSLDLPPGVEAVEREGGDFFLYYFAKKRQPQILFAYFGFAPSFPNEAPRGAKSVEETVAGFPTTSIRWRDATGGFCRESLVHVADKDWLRFIHFAYGGLNEKMAKEADAIIATLRFTRAE